MQGAPPCGGAWVRGGTHKKNNHRPSRPTKIGDLARKGGMDIINQQSTNSFNDELENHIAYLACFFEPQSA